MSAIIIAVHEKDSHGREQLIASHGVDMATGREFVVSQDHPAKLGATFDRTLGEWVLSEVS